MSHKRRSENANSYQNNLLCHGVPLLTLEVDKCSILVLFCHVRVGLDNTSAAYMRFFLVVICFRRALVLCCCSASRFVAGRQNERWGCSQEASPTPGTLRRLTYSTSMKEGCCQDCSRLPLGTPHKASTVSELNATVGQNGPSSACSTNMC